MCVYKERPIRLSRTSPLTCFFFPRREGRSIIRFSDDLPVQVQLPPCGLATVLVDQDAGSLSEVVIQVLSTANLSSIEFSLTSLMTGSDVVPDANDISFSEEVDSDISSNAQIEVLESGIVMLISWRCIHCLYHFVDKWMREIVDFLKTRRCLFSLLLDVGCLRTYNQRRKEGKKLKHAPLDPHHVLRYPTDTNEET